MNAPMMDASALDAGAMDTHAESSPKRKARMAGLFYLITILTGVFAQAFISERLVVSGDAAATAANILAHEALYRLGFAVYLVEMACQIVMTALMYELLRPVSRSVSLLALILGLVGCTIKTFSRLFYIAPLLVLGNAHYLSVFSAEQLQSLALLSLNINDQGAGIALAFFGIHAVLKGYLVVRSTFLPHALGVATVIGGLGWLAFLSPPLGNRLFPYIAAVGLLGAVVNIVWLLVFGVNEERWKAQVIRASAPLAS